MLDELKQKFLDLSPKDQLMLAVGALAVLVYILLFVILLPMQSEMRKMEKRNMQALDEQGEVRELAGKLLAKQNAGESTGGDQSLNGILNSSLRAHGLLMENFQPSGNSARVRLRSGEFNKVLGWINEMEVRQGMTIKNLTMTADESPGSVMVSLTIQQGG